MSQHVSKITPQRSLATNFGIRFANLLTLSSASILALNAHNNELRVCLIKVTLSQSKRASVIVTQKNTVEVTHINENITLLVLPHREGSYALLSKSRHNIDAVINNKTTNKTITMFERILLFVIHSRNLLFRPFRLSMNVL